MIRPCCVEGELRFDEADLRLYPFLLNVARRCPAPLLVSNLEALYLHTCASSAVGMWGEVGVRPFHS